jgi:hypothetical protein
MVLASKRTVTLIWRYLSLVQAELILPTSQEPRAYMSGQACMWQANLPCMKKNQEWERERSHASG